MFEANIRIFLLQNVTRNIIYSLTLYTELATTNWLFNEGFYLHSRITISIFDKDAPFLFFHTMGWGRICQETALSVKNMDSNNFRFACDFCDRLGDCHAGQSKSDLGSLLENYRPRLQVDHSWTNDCCNCSKKQEVH